MGAMREAASSIVQSQLRLSHTTVRRIIDRLPESVLKIIVAETVNRNAVAATGDCCGVLPCPFCGGNADFDTVGNTVICDECYATGAEHQTPAIAIALWNRRVPVRVVAG